MLEYPPTGKDASRLGRVRQSGEEKGKAFCLIILKLVNKKIINLRSSPWG
jgi:hypothetical protein